MQQILIGDYHAMAVLLALPAWFWNPLLSYLTAAPLLVIGVSLAIKKSRRRRTGWKKSSFVVLCSLACPWWCSVESTSSIPQEWWVPVASPRWYRLDSVPCFLGLSGGSVSDSGRLEHSVPEICRVVGRTFRGPGSMF